MLGFCGWFSWVDGVVALLYNCFGRLWVWVDALVLTLFLCFWFIVNIANSPAGGACFLLCVEWCILWVGSAYICV